MMNGEEEKYLNPLKTIVGEGMIIIITGEMASPIAIIIQTVGFNLQIPSSC